MSVRLLRPARPEDHPAVVAITDAQDLLYRGQTDFTLEILRDQILADASVDAERDLVVLEERGSVIAYGLYNGGAAYIGVLPGHESPELRAGLISWAEGRQSELGRTSFRGGCDAVDAPAVASWVAAGYSLDEVHAQMVRTFGETDPPEPGELPDGYKLRLIDRDTDAAALHKLNERAFAEHSDHEPQSLADYTRAHLTFSQFDPSWSFLVETPDGHVAGSLVGWRPPDHVHGYIAVLAVDPARRRLGLARVMLLAAFSAIHMAGLPTAELFVSSNNPRALDLYTSVGMREGEQMNVYSRPPSTVQHATAFSATSSLDPLPGQLPLP